MSTEPTKADLKAAVAKLTEEKAVLAAENAALYGLFAAIRHGSEGHGELPWIIGYAGSIGNDDHVGRNVRTLRAHARNLRRGPGCHAEHDGHYCDLRAGHAPARHEVHGDDGELIAAWDDEPAPSGMQDPAPVVRVITDSERTCPEQHPGSGAPCHHDGDHGVHRDPDGEEWRTDGTAECSASRDGYPCIVTAAGHTADKQHLDKLGRSWADAVTDDGQTYSDEPEYPAAGSAIPPEQNGGMTGYVVGQCGHRVAGSEWRAGFRVCERCPVSVTA